MAQPEGRLQAECVKWYRNEWYQDIHFLWATFNEGANTGAKNSLGMTVGVSDLLKYEPKGRGLIGIEMKYPGESHTVSRVTNQAKWILEVCDCGGFCDDFEQFKSIIQGRPVWIDPRKVLAYLEKVKTGSFVWDRNKFI